MKKSLNDEKHADDAVQRLAGAYVAYEQITDAGKRMVVLGIAKKSLDDMLTSFCQQNPDFSLGAFVKLLGMSGQPPVSEPHGAQQAGGQQAIH